MSKTRKDDRHVADGDWDNYSGHLKNKIVASARKSRTAGKQKFKKEIMGSIGDVQSSLYSR